ncbi:arylsulfatase B-like isoform X3 [Acanthaster planci]|uniref:Arylsulfatase B-like isoform X3 n=1 Tax=Acanthaster planci TaxID=133434 RepID=A0A8B7ZFJ2_ACAPL|nr:arylsulfatase B-like isoform X3 [Acanthaster planci]
MSLTTVCKRWLGRSGVLGGRKLLFLLSLLLLMMAGSCLFFNEFLDIRRDETKHSLRQNSRIIANKTNIFKESVGKPISANSTRESIDASTSHHSTNLRRKQPNIVFILADDYGYHDIGYHGSVIKTPVLDRLAAEGVKLSNYYVQPICTPTRTQLMTGRYQIHTGFQHAVLYPTMPSCLPLDEITIAQKLKEAGYSTHIVGKWHLGFYKKACWPTRRGFDTFFGFLEGSGTYYSHMRGSFYDFRDQEDVAWQYKGQYSTHLFAKRAQEIITKHDKEKPFFLFVSMQAVHIPLEVPESYVRHYAHIKDKKRRTYAGMTTCMDEAVGNITTTLDELGLWNDTLLIFSTDNGGAPEAGGFNWPLRGRKKSLWEGGVRGIGSGAPSARKEILHNIDPFEGHKPPFSDSLYNNLTFTPSIRAAVRVGDWKLLTGPVGAGHWTPPPESGKAMTHSTMKPEQNIWLFNVRDDPNEKSDLSEERQDIVKKLMGRLQDYFSTSVPVLYPDSDSRGNPRRLGVNYWTNWM